MTLDLFAHLTPQQERLEVAEGVVLFKARLHAAAPGLLQALAPVLASTELRSMQTAGGKAMSVRTASCGPLGWVSDSRGYRYAACDPVSGNPWPPMPPLLHQAAEEAAAQAGFPGFDPDACLINRYDPGARMGLHQDKDEADFSQPIVSFSFGLPAIFLLGGRQRSGPTLKLYLEHGDVLVWGGPARMRFHGVQPVKPGHHPQVGDFRLNLTFRRAGPL